MLVRNLLALILLGLWLVGCGPTPGEGEGESSPTPSPAASGSPNGRSSPTAVQQPGPPPDVVVTRVEEKQVSLFSEYTARTEARLTVDVKSQVQGSLLDFSFQEGTFVNRGQVLFQVDPSTYEAQLSSALAQVEKARADLEYAKNQVDLRKAQADLTSAKAELKRTQQDIDRYKPLAFRSVIPMQTYDNAVSARDVAAAQVNAKQAVVDNTRLSDRANIDIAAAQLEAAQASVEQARITLGYCTITAPFDGVIGKLNVSPGNLVRVGDPVLVTISESNPMYVDFSIAETDYLKYFKSRPGQGVARPFELLLGDGARYPERGSLQMVGRTIDQQTGTLNLRASFLNPTGILKPGQFARIRFKSTDLKHALLVPQRAVFEIQSLNAAYVVGPDNVATQVNLTLGQTFEQYYVVESGLKAGDRVIVEGIQKVRSGWKVNPSEVGGTAE